MCSDECRVVNEKRWRKKYDSQDHIKKAKAERELKRYYREKALRESKALFRH